LGCRRKPRGRGYSCAELSNRPQQSSMAALFYGDAMIHR
jgi:hypothetical protein